VTTSVASPTRWKTPMSSKSGGTTWPYPAAETVSSKVRTNRRQRADSGGKTSRMPGLVWNSGTTSRLPATIGPDGPESVGAAH